LVRVGGKAYPTPFAWFCPDIEGEQLEEFMESVRRYGVVVPVEVDDHGNVVDGRHRLRAAAALGMTEVPIEVLTGISETVKLKHFYIRNLMRAIYTSEQEGAIRKAGRALGQKYFTKKNRRFAG
jgi:ParB-like chromosome segregation protein Spo0J